jgi:hypothetical protein
MNTAFPKEDFNALDFDTKCIVMEQLLTDDYFTGQMEINFSYEVDEKTGNLLPQSTEIQEREDELFNQLIIRLTDKLFKDKTIIELDLEKIYCD